MRNKIKKRYIILFVLLIFFSIVGIIIYNNISPMLVDGTIVELEGTIKEIDEKYIILKSDDGDTYKCKIDKNTYYIKSYEPKVSEHVTIIYNYDENVIKNNETKDIKEILIKRIYKMQD